jgi:acyl carrier protein
MSTESILADHIIEEIAVGKTKGLKPEEDLFSSGILDSLGVLQLVLFIEEKFSITVSDEDVVYENFNSIFAIARYIDEKKSSSS